MPFVAGPAVMSLSVAGQQVQQPSSASLLFDPTSLSLAVSHHDSSLSLHSSPSLASPPTLVIPPPASSSTFLHLSTSPPTTLFLVSSHPHSNAILLHFYRHHHHTKSFQKIQALCNHKDFHSHQGETGLLFRVAHGVSVKLHGDVNVFLIYSLSNSKIWVFSVRMVGGEAVKLMKTAVIDCCLPVFSIGLKFGYLILGEENGVRVFPLQRLVRGRVRSRKDNKLNGFIQGINGVHVSIRENHGAQSMDNQGSGNVSRFKGNHSESTSLRTLKVRQDSEEVGAYFVELKHEGVELPQTTKNQRKSVKVICIQSLSPKKFLILDSVGELHVLCLFHPMGGSDLPCLMKNLPQAMKIHRLAVFPDISAKNGTVWISDGHNSIHMIELSDMDTSGSDNDKKDIHEQKIQLSVPRAIFSGEKIRDIVAIAPNAVLVLGQGNIFTYDIS